MDNGIARANVTTKKSVATCHLIVGKKCDTQIKAKAISKVIYGYLLA
jgi:hypothetical protein